MSPRPIPDDVRRKQADASDPSCSAFVAANAGSGKTHVLAQRVIRLMLDGGPGGVDPSRILCITFTKAAAANMAARVYDRLRGLDRARRRRARRGHARDRRHRHRRRASARGRGPCSPPRWRRRAASRSRPSTPSAPGCSSSFRSRRTWRRASPCWTTAPRPRCSNARRWRCCSGRRAHRRARSAAPSSAPSPGLRTRPSARWCTKRSTSAKS